MGHRTLPLRNRLRELRADRGWTQADLARQLGVSRQTVNAIEVGRYDPSLPLAFRMARVLDLRIEAIFKDGSSDVGDAGSIGEASEVDS